MYMILILVAADVLKWCYQDLYLMLYLSLAIKFDKCKSVFSMWKFNYHCGQMAAWYSETKI